MPPPALPNRDRPGEPRKDAALAVATRNAAQPAALQAGPNAVALLQALRRRWGPACALGLLLAGAVTAVVWHFLPPPKQSASAKIYMPVDPEGKLYKHPEWSPNFNQFQQTQMALIKSRLVLNAAVRNPKVASLSVIRHNADPVAWLERELRIDFPSGNEVARISLQGDYAPHLQVIVDAVVDAYLLEVVDKQTRHRQERLDDLTRLYEFYQQNLKRASKTRRELAQSVGGSTDKPSLALRQKMAQEQFNLAQRDLIKLESDLRRLKLEESAFNVKPGDQVVIPANLVSEKVEADKGVEGLREQKDRLEHQYKTVHSKIYTDPDDPKLQEKRKEIADVGKQLDDRRAELRARIEGQLRERAVNDQVASLEHLRKQITFSEDLRKLLVQEVTRLDKESKQINDGSLNLEEFQFELEQAEASAKTVAMEKMKLETEKDAPARVRRLEDAVPYAPENSLMRRGGIAGGSGLAALVAVLLGVALLEFRFRRVSSPDQVAQGLGIRLVGTVPAPPTRTRRLLGLGGAEAAWQAMLTESVDALRTMLLYEARQAGVRTVLVTSAVNGEGKTSLSCHLAVSLARAGRRTLLLDCDLRRPSVHKLFAVPQGPGFSELLRGEVGCDEAIQPTSADNLFLLPAGQCDRRALQALACDGLAECFRLLREQFEFIVIDSCPVLPLNDALLLAQQADAVLFSVLREVSRLPLVHAAAQRLSTLGASLLGAVVCGTHDELSSYGPRYPVARPDGAASL
jgi:capsular exopolysaccharide synthesis family protein